MNGTARHSLLSPPPLCSLRREQTGGDAAQLNGLAPVSRHSPFALLHSTLLLLVCLCSVSLLAAAEKSTVAWNDCHRQKPEWYAGEEAIRIADNVLLYQRSSGGWPKNIDMARLLDDAQKDTLRKDKQKTDSTLDNNATHTQIRYLAKVYEATRIERFKTGFIRAIDYLLAAQYPGGGWPQFYPLRGGYSNHVTFNDGAMIGAMGVLGDVARREPPFAPVDQQRCRRAEEAVEKGIECILRLQIVVDGKRTAWCAQHDEKTGEPRPARSYEKASISGAESVGVVRFLMGLDDPSPRIVEAVESAVAWFEQAKIPGIRQAKVPDPAMPRGFDHVIVEDPTAVPIWARFYEIGSNRPIFCSRDGIIRRRLAEISPERRTGYAWYGYWPATLLSKDYPAWRK